MHPLANKTSLVLFVLFWQLDISMAQGTFTVLNTGGGQPLVTQTRSVTVDGALQNPQLQFLFGFATDENFIPGNFFDSLTVTIQDTGQLFTAIYLTADASGTVFAPATPGTLFIEPSTINFGSIAYPSLQPVLAQRNAFQVSALIPSQFAGRTINVFFDLFDNLDPLASQGWFTDPQVAAVPESAVWRLLLFAGAIGWSIRKFKKLK